MLESGNAAIALISTFIACIVEHDCIETCLEIEKTLIIVELRLVSLDMMTPHILLPGVFISSLWCSATIHLGTLWKWPRIISPRAFEA